MCLVPVSQWGVRVTLSEVEEQVKPEAMVGLWLTVPASAGGPVAVSEAGAVLQRAGVRSGQPFVLAADGSYDLHLNRFLRELDGWGVRARNSIAAYSRDVMLFCRFLHSSRGGKSIWECDGGDLRAYKTARLRVDGPYRVSVSTWNRSVAALDKWVRWALYEGLLEREPFRYLDRQVMTPQGLRQMRANAELESDRQTRPVRFVSYEDYLLWRNVGLRGELPDGTPDPSWRGRHAERNAAFADLLMSTGMRLGEAASLLVCEVPPQSGDRGFGGVHLSAAVTKRNKPRTVFMTRRTLRAVHHYVEIERDAVVQRQLSTGGYTAATDVVTVRGTGRLSLALADGRGSWPLSKIDPGQRARLRRQDGTRRPGEPLWLWLGRDGLPLRPATWQSAFQRANERCARFDIPVAVHPHLLRHSYAVHMLGLLLRETVRALGGREDGQLTRAEVKRLLIGNPMRKLQLLLGHSQESTVYDYLDVLDEAQEIVLSAMAHWDSQVAVLDRVTVTRP